MLMEKVLFVGGSALLPSVRMRCVDLAERLGCGYRTDIQSVKELPRGYQAFVLVKPALSAEELRRLAQVGPVIWDVIDRLPPVGSKLACCIVSSLTAERMVRPRWPTVLLPHYHCNFSAVPNSPRNRRPAFVGSRQWLPLLPSLTYDFYDSSKMTRAQVFRAYRQVGIGLNLRVGVPGSELHVSINSGIKLINCLGFGLPSVSADEPAYREIAEDCTLFARAETCARQVRKLTLDNALYARLRSNCLRRAKDYHIDAIARRYRRFIASL
jgi:hypothetical protein